MLSVIMNSKVLENMYKSKSANFGNVRERRKEKSEKLKNDRQNRRVHNFNERRNIQEVELSIEECNDNETSFAKNGNVNQVSNRKLALKRYLAEKEKIKMNLRLTKRPPFKVGIPHHGSSPVLKNILNHPCAYQNKGALLKKQTTVKREKKNESASKIKKSALSNNNNNKEEIIQLRRSKRSLPKKAVTHKNKISESKASSTKNHCNIPKITKNKSQETFPLSPPLNIEQCKKEVLGDGPIFQRARLDAESSRLLMLAKEWEIIGINEEPPTEIADEIDSLVGNTKLLTADKFNQFRGLIDKCENPVGRGPIITINDLNGFWEMMYLQVEPLIQRYNVLRTLKENNWIKQEPQFMKKQRTKRKPNILKNTNFQDKLV